MGCRCRCRDCRARVTLRLRPDWYIRRRKCKHCGSYNLVIDQHRNSGKEYDPRHKKICTCDGRHYPHRLGSRGCNKHLDAHIEPDWYEPFGGYDTCNTNTNIDMDANSRTKSETEMDNE